MKKVAVAIAALFVLSIVAPAFSQPFADVPTDHWAFDAIAELAAKGIVEGYPDGTFKGDRAMTRYEMAMVVARLLARVEAIKIPPAAPPTKVPPPEVGRADIQTLQRLVNEFRAELAALGVRVTAVEEELAALRARVDATRVEGYAFFRYQAPVASAPYTFGLFNLTFTGDAGRGVRAVVNTVLDAGDSGIFAFRTQDTSGTYPVPGVTFDRAYLEWGAYGLSWRLGRQTYTLGAIGLLFAEASLRVNAGNSSGVDGLKLTGTFGPVSFEAAGFTHTMAANITAVTSLLMGRASMSLMPGWTFGANIYSERNNYQAAPPNVNHNGWSVDLRGNIIPGVTLTAEYATFTPSGAASQNAYQVNTVLSLAQLTGMTQFSPTLTIQYKNYPTLWSPVMPGGSDLFGSVTGAGASQAFQGWNAQLGLTFSPQFRPYVNYEAGTLAGSSTTELELGFRSAVAAGLTARFRYQIRTLAGVTTTNRYRLQLDWSW